MQCSLFLKEIRCASCLAARGALRHALRAKSKFRRACRRNLRSEFFRARGREMFWIINRRDLRVAIYSSHEASIKPPRTARHRAACIFHQKGHFTAFLMRCNRRLLTFQASLVDFHRVFCYAERRKNAKEPPT